MTQDSAHPGRPGGPDPLHETGHLTGHATGQQAGRGDQQELSQDIMPDLCVIGSDAVALATAAAAAGFGVSVVLVENRETGGAQRDGGALLSKALLAAAAHVNAMRTGAHFGVKTVRFGVDFNAVRAHVQDVLDAVAPLQSRERLKGRMDVLYVTPDYFDERPKPCMNGWGRQYLAVNPTGDVLPCPTAAASNLTQSPG